MGVQKWYLFQVNCIAGVDAKHRVCKCRVAKHVNCIGVKDKGSTSKHTVLILL